MKKAVARATPLYLYVLGAIHNSSSVYTESFTWNRTDDNSLTGSNDENDLV